MRYEVIAALEAIERRWPKDFAKICEKLLAIAFDRRRGGFSVESTSIQGVDISMLRPQVHDGSNERYAIEVKTAHGNIVTLTENDLGKLRRRRENEAYASRVAAFNVLTAEWVVADAKRFRPGQYSLERLKLDVDDNLLTIAQANFPPALFQFKSGIVRPQTGTPLTFLDAVLAREQDSSD